MTDKLTFAALGLKQVADVEAVAWAAEQQVEPERNGEPWCTWEDAEGMLTLAAQSVLQGAGGVQATRYVVTRDEGKAVLGLAVG